MLGGTEGGRMQLEAKIKSDPRHRGVIVLLGEEHVQPEFQRMGDGI